VKLTHIKELGRYQNLNTKQKVNIKQGRNMKRGTDHLFYLYRGKKMFISQADFYGGIFKKIVS
jgi:hypothetical protein